MGTINVDNIKNAAGGNTDIKIGTTALTSNSSGELGINTTPVSGTVLTINDASSFGGIQFQLNGSNSGYIGSSASNVFVGGTNNCVFHTGDATHIDGTERMRIDSSGFVGIGTTSPVNALHVENSGNTVFCMERSGKSSGSGFAGFNIEGNSQLTISYDDGAPFVIGTASNPSTQAGFTNHFKIDSDGTLTATDTSIGSISDERLKKNIADYTYDLEKFKQYKPKTFDWINPSNHNGKTGNRGFLAQDVKSIDDKWVGEFEIDEKNPDYGIIPDNVSLTSKLGDKDTMYISVIQQLITKVETLESEIAKLKG